jgi:hypothetical protein
LYSRQDPPIFLHCVDSRLEENGSWYSRLHLGPFTPGTSLQIGNRLRRSLLNDLAATSPVAVELEGVVHEFTRLPGVQESVLDLLFQFRKLTLSAPFLKLGEIMMVPFLFLGQVIFVLVIFLGHTEYNVGILRLFWLLLLKELFYEVVY